MLLSNHYLFPSPQSSQLLKLARSQLLTLRGIPSSLGFRDSTPNLVTRHNLAQISRYHYCLYSDLVFQAGPLSSAHFTPVTAAED